LGVGWREHGRALLALRQSLALPRVATISKYARPLTLVLPVFTRPQNAALSVALALRTPGVRRVIVSINRPSIAPAGLQLPADDRVVIMRHSQVRGPVQRYRALADDDARWFLSIDDDVFLSPEQMGRLADELAARPASPHGFYGQHFDPATRNFNQGVVRSEGSVHVLNRAYAFSREHLDRYLSLLERLAVDESGVSLDDDVVLSFCGTALPCVHDIGAYVDCPSEARAAISRWGRPQAATVRAELFDQLHGLVGTPAPGAPRAVKPRFAWQPRSAAWAAAFYATPLGPTALLTQRALGFR
jgi:hypothetical protein